MPDDPFAGLSDTTQNRRQRATHVRRQKWRAFWLSVGATVLVAVATGAGAALAGERSATAALDHFLGGAVYGLVGGAMLLLVALWWLTREAVVEEVTGTTEGADPGAVLFWAAVFGAVAGGCLGGSSGLALKAGGRSEVLLGALVAGLLALIPAVLLRRSASRRSRGGSGARREQD